MTIKPVPIKTPAPFGDGVTAKITDLGAMVSEGQGPGEISAPAIKVTIELKNGTSKPLPVDQVTVNATYGADATPAVLIFGDPATKPFTGTVKVGETLTGVYVINVPKDQRDNVAISVSHAALSPIVVFEGRVS